MQITDFDGRSFFDRSLRGFEQPIQQVEESGFTTAIDADQTDSIRSFAQI